MASLVATVGGLSVELEIKRPAFEPLWNAYAEVGHKDAARVYELVGGDVLGHRRENPVDYSNACALRMSRAFNNGGYAVPSGTIVPSTAIYRVRGGDELPYIMRVDGIIHFVKHNWGSADQVFSPDEAGKLSGMKGLIIIEVSGWSDASGHVTLWDGAQTGDGTGYHDPNNQSYGNGISLTRILYWELK